MEEQMQVRQRLIKYVNDKGVPLAWIGRKINLCRQLMSDFKNGKTLLYRKTLAMLDEFLSNENY